MISGQCVRDENDASCKIKYDELILFLLRFDDMIEWRVKNGKPRQPTLLILTATGNLPVLSKFYGDGEQRVCIITNSAGSMALKRRLGDINPASRWALIEIIEIPSCSDHSLDLANLLSHLSSSLGIKYLDISCGGNVIRQLRDLKILDEIRWTLSGQVCGGMSEEGKERPTAFPKEGRSYTEANSVLVKWIEVPRVLGDRLIFLRGEYEYRH